MVTCLLLALPAAAEGQRSVVAETTYRPGIGMRDATAHAGSPYACDAQSLPASSHPIERGRGGREASPAAGL